jgi:hypothetical protein
VRDQARSVGKRVDFVALVREHLREELTAAGVVVHDEDSTRTIRGRCALAVHD